MSATPGGSVLPDSRLKELIRSGGIVLNEEARRVQPASLDLGIGAGTVCEVAGIPNLTRDFSVRQFISQYSLNHYNLADGPVTLRRESVYVVQLAAELDLPKTVSGYANPKSSAGRVDGHCIVITEGGREFNVVPHGYKGALYMLIVPQSFPLRLTAGEALCQLRLFAGKRSFLDGTTALTRLNKQLGLVLDGNPSFIREGIVLHLNLKGNPSNLVANRAGRPIDLADRHTMDPRSFFREKLLDDNGNLFLEPGEFVLASTIESLSIPDSMCGEMVAFDERWGELRTHYAGFFDPGFGRGRDVAVGGSAVVCEIRNMGTAPVILSHSQPICMLRFERLSEVPETAYGETSASEASNYQGQEKVKLAKYFAPWK